MRNSFIESKSYKKISQGLSEEIKHAFSMENSDETSHIDENKFLEDFADSISKRKLAVPAIMFLETFRPLNYIGSQAMIFFRPFMSIIFPPRKYDKISKIMEKRDSISKLIGLLGKK